LKQKVRVKITAVRRTLRITAVEGFTSRALSGVRA